MKFWLPLVLICLSGCVTSNIAGDEDTSGHATLELFPMAVSDASTRCLIVTLDGEDVRDRQSKRLTSKYLIPPGSHKIGFACEEYVGSVAMFGYGFELEFTAEESGNYGLLQRRSRDKECIYVASQAGSSAEQVLAENCRN